MGGSSGASGKVDFPEYMKGIHGEWLNKLNSIGITTSMASLMNTAMLGNNPYTTSAAYNPDTDLAAMITAGNLMQSLATSLNGSAPIATAVSAINSSIADIKTISNGLATNVPIANIVSDILASRDDLKDVLDDLRTSAPVPDLVDQLEVIHSSFAPVVSSVLYDNYTNDVIAEYTNEVHNRLDSNILPRFNAGMRNIGAVVSSSFAIGRAVIEAEQEREIGTFGSQLYLKSASDDALKLIASKLEFQKVVSDNLMRLIDHNVSGQQQGSAAIAGINGGLLKARSDVQAIASGTEIDARMKLIDTNLQSQDTAAKLTADVNRIKIVAKKEQYETDLEIDSNDALWDLEIYQYGANLLACIGGGTMVPKNRSNKTGSAIGGGLSGAAMGGVMGAAKGSYFSWPGALIGGVLGAAAGYFGNS